MAASDELGRDRHAQPSLPRIRRQDRPARSSMPSLLHCPAAHDVEDRRAIAGAGCCRNVFGCFALRCIAGQGSRRSTGDKRHEDVVVTGRPFWLHGFARRHRFRPAPPARRQDRDVLLGPACRRRTSPRQAPARRPAVGRARRAPAHVAGIRRHNDVDPARFFLWSAGSAPPLAPTK